MPTPRLAVIRAVWGDVLVGVHRFAVPPEKYWFKCHTLEVKLFCECVANIVIWHDKAGVFEYVCELILFEHFSVSAGTAHYFCCHTGF